MVRIDVAVFGDLNIDVILKVPRMPVKDTSIAASKAVISPGGVAGNVSTHLVVRGLKPLVVGGVGRDVMGDYLLNRLRGVGALTDHVVRIDGEPTGVMIILIVEGGEKVITGYRGANMEVKVSEDESARIAELVRHVHASGYTALNKDRGESLINILKASVCEGVSTSIDLEGLAVQAREFIHRLKGLVNYVFINRSEAESLCGTDPVSCIKSLITELRASAAFLKMGVDGSAIATWRGGEVVVEKVPQVRRVNAVDTTGAGDAFNAAVINALLKGLSPREAAEEGNEAGAEACTYFGGMHPKALKLYGK